MSIVFKTDVFLTHDWGEDELKRSNHERVSRVNKALQKKGLRTWFDEERMNGNIRDKMAEGIEETKIVVAFITEKYRQKVNSNSAIDNCYFEFNYATLEKTGNFMIPVVMEPRMRNPRDWKGRLGAELGTHLYIDLSDDETFDKKVEELYQLIQQTIAAYEETLKSSKQQQFPPGSRRGSHVAALDPANESTTAVKESVSATNSPRPAANGNNDPIAKPSSSLLTSNAKAVLANASPPLSSVSLSPRTTTNHPVGATSPPPSNTATSAAIKPSIGAKTALHSLNTQTQSHPHPNPQHQQQHTLLASPATSIPPSSTTTSSLTGGDRKFSFASSLLKSINDSNSGPSAQQGRSLPPFTEFPHYNPPASSTAPITASITTTSQTLPINSSIYTGGSPSLRLHQPPDPVASTASPGSVTDPLSSSLPKKFSFADSLTQSINNNNNNGNSHSSGTAQGTGSDDPSSKKCPWCATKNERGALACTVCKKPMEASHLSLSGKTCPWCYGKNDTNARSCQVCHQPLDTNRLPSDLVQESLALNNHSHAQHNGQGQGQGQQGGVHIKLTSHPLSSVPEGGAKISPRISPRLSFQTGAMIIHQLSSKHNQGQEQGHEHAPVGTNEKVCPWCQAKNVPTARHCTKCQSRF